ncbi:MAG: asparagine synthase C-terminal domain-containing protein, partial [Methylocystis sp.]|nr:asparagine synthase C-terminal domain-containing protein [Methylocystis sp.]
LSTRLLYKKARERGVKVVLTGEGSDEIFGGYPVFRAALSRTPSELWLFQLYRLYAGRRHGGFYRAFRRIMRVYLDETGDRFDALRLFELRNQLPNNYIMKVDKASMSVSVEARVPFLDQRVVDIALRVPREHLLTHGSEKGLLRDMAARYRLLPEEIGDRPKFGASVAASWMDEHPGFRDYARDVIMSGGGWTEALGLKGAMLDYFVRGRSGYSFPRAVSIFRNLAWRLLLLELWGKSMGVSVDLR